MLSFISFLLVCVGCINWFCIGILQYDFVAGIFGSQSNIFSRLIYTLVGIASIIMIVNLITNKGKFVVSFKKANKEFEEYKEEKHEEQKARLARAIEAENEFNKQQHLYSNTESSNDNYKNYTNENTEALLEQDISKNSNKKNK